MKKILLLGDYIQYRWHPLKGVDEAIERILATYKIDVCSEYPSLKLDRLQTYDLLINYIDAWDERGNPALAGAIIACIASGGAMLCIHNGIITHKNPDLEQVFGATFTSHPPHQVLSYATIGDREPFNRMTPFKIDEEPYQFELDNLANVTMVSEYTYEGEHYPAAWIRTFGSGRLCYLSPGHSAASFLSAGFADLIRAGAAWCLDESGQEARTDGTLLF